MDESPPPRVKPASPLKTYSHLAAGRRMPTDYELVTSQLLYYARSGFETEVAVADWYRRHQRGSCLRGDFWEAFQDPRSTTYARYVALQRKRSDEVQGVLDWIQNGDYDDRLPETWRARFDRFITPLRYPWHAFQMVAAYIGQMAPSGRITVAAAFQAADEMRRIQVLAYRIALLRRRHAVDAGESLRAWQCDGALQPMREAVERLLVAYDWGEAFVALNLCMKPLLDRLLVHELARVATAMGDPLFSPIFGSLEEDCAWQQSYSLELAKLAILREPDNRGIVGDLVQRWFPISVRALDALSDAWPELGPAEQRALAWYEKEFLPKLELGGIV
jgi:toluene monooxygenase system protein E